MDKQLIERIALEVAEEFFSMATTSPLVFKCHIPEFATRFLARIDAERWKEAVAAQYRTREQDEGLFGEWNTVGYQPQGPASPLLEIRPLFLSPAIPSGMALVPIEPTVSMLKAAERANDRRMISYERAYEAMLAAAQGERNAD